MNAGVGAQPVLRPNLRSVLFLPAEAADGPADAVRDAALELGARSERPVLLLDLAIPGNQQYLRFAAAGLLEPRASPPGAGPPGFAVLHFERVRGTGLYVSRVSPDPACFEEVTWALDGFDALPRLHALFGAVVIAGPELAKSPGGLRLAACVDGVVLTLRPGRTTVAEATALRDLVLAAGGRLMGSVLTQCPVPRAPTRAWA